MLDAASRARLEWLQGAPPPGTCQLHEPDTPRVAGPAARARDSFARQRPGRPCAAAPHADPRLGRPRGRARRARAPRTVPARRARRLALLPHLDRPRGPALL